MMGFSLTLTFHDGTTVTYGDGMKREDYDGILHAIQKGKAREPVQFSGYGPNGAACRGIGRLVNAVNDEGVNVDFRVIEQFEEWQ